MKRFFVYEAETNNSRYVAEEKYGEHLGILKQVETVFVEGDGTYIDAISQHLRAVYGEDVSKRIHITRQEEVIVGVWKYEWVVFGEEVRYTPAPIAYDGMGTKRDGCMIEFLGTTYNRVYIEKEHLEWQVNRYNSGLYGALTYEQIKG